MQTPSSHLSREWNGMGVASPGGGVVFAVLWLWAKKQSFLGISWRVLISKVSQTWKKGMKLKGSFPVIP